MKNWYFGTYIVGFKNLIESQLKQDLVDVKIAMSYDGIIQFNTSELFEEVRDLPYFNNVFTSLNTYKMPEFNTNTAIDAILSDPVANQALHNLRFRNNNTFKISVVNENSTQGFSPETNIPNLEFYIKEKTGMKLDIRAAQVEFWLLYRNEGTLFWGVRKKPKRVELAKGQLRPEVAHLLVLLSKPIKKEVFLEPFVGFGSIAKARLSYPHTKVIVWDQDKYKVEAFKKAMGVKPSLTTQVGDFFELAEKLEKRSIDKIVTDPPWGIFDETLEVESFYKDMLLVFSRVLKPQGVLVLLTRRDAVIKQLVTEQFEKIEQFDVLISGKKASVYRCKH